MKSRLLPTVSPGFVPAGFLAAGLLTCAALPGRAQWVDVFATGFETQPVGTAALTDVSDTDPQGPFTITDDDPHAGNPGSGVQVAGWDAKTGTKSLLVRAGSETILQLQGPRSGTRYQLDFDLKTVTGDGDRNFYFILRSMGLDSNGDDFLAYRGDRGAGTGFWHYQGIGFSGWAEVPEPRRAEDTWQHHRFLIDMRTQTFDLFINNMEVPAVTGAYLSRPGAPVPTAIILRHEGNSADDGYFLLDDIALKTEGSKDLAVPYTEGFESYTAMENFADDADPAAVWVTAEAAGSGDGKPIDDTKIQVVDATVVTARTGAKSLKLEGGQQAGVSYAWGPTTQPDVEITWWARVPESIQGTTGNYLRMSLYGVEGGRADQGDAALLGYGSRDANVGDGTSLTIFTTAWQNSNIDYTPDTWEQYRLTTHTAEGTYSIVKSPDGVPEIIADRRPFIGSAASWGPMFMVAWSSSNGAGHPPVYIDDITVRAMDSGAPEEVVQPYTAVSETTRFTTAATVRMPAAVGGAAVDPRDSKTIVAAIDSINGALYQVKQNAQGVWELDTVPLVSGLSNPSGLVIDAEGTIWWTHDFTQSVRRLKAPWRDHQQEAVISGFGGSADDDPIDLAITGAAFSGTIGKPGHIVVADRDVEASGQRGIYQFDPATIGINVTDFSDFLVGPTSELGGGTLNSVSYLAATSEVVTVNNDETIALTNAEGVVRTVFPTTAFTYLAGVAGDPVTGRIWLADRDLAEIWSINPDSDNPADRKEVRFDLADPERPERRISFNDPGLAFSADGTMLVVSDSSAENRGGWLTILSGQPASPPAGPVVISSAQKTPAGFVLTWSPLTGAKYRVFRSTALDGGFQDISNELTVTTFTDATPPDGRAFYRIQSVTTP